MQILLISNHIKAFIKIISVFAVNRRRQISCSVQRSTVRAQNQTGRHTEFFKVDYLRAFACFKKAFFFQLVNNGLHFVGVKSFSGITVESYIQLFVNGVHIIHCKRFEPLEKGVRFLVAAFYKFEVFARLCLHIFVRLVIKADVQIVYGMNTAGLHFFFVSPMLVSAYKLTELSTVIAQMINTHNIIAQKLKKLIERAAYYRSRQMPDMKGLCDIDRRVIDTNCFTVSDDGRTEFILTVLYFAYYRFCKFIAVDFEI